MTDKHPCSEAVNAAVKGAFSDAEIAAVVDRLVLRKAKLKSQIAGISDAAALHSAAEGLLRDEVVQALTSQRAHAFTMLAEKGRWIDYERMSGSEADKLDAATVGNDRAGFGSNASVDNMGRAHTSELVQDLMKAWRASGVAKIMSSARRDLKFQKDCFIEMARLNGGKEKPTGNDLAVKVAEGAVPVVEKSRLMQNEAGAWIGKLPGYIVRQNHDPIKVGGGFWAKLGKIKPEALDAAQAAIRKTWVDDQLRLLDDRTYSENLGYTAKRWAGTTPDVLADKRAWLEAGWFNIVTGEHSGESKGGRIDGFLPKSGRAKAVSAERVYHYKSAEAAWEYHQKYGEGDLSTLLIRQFDAAGRNTALMQRFGPNPEAAWDKDVSKMLSLARERGDAAAGEKIKDWRVQSGFKQVAGLLDRPQNLRLAHVVALVLKHESVTKLGGMVLSAFPDIGVASNHLLRTGVPFLDAYGSVLAPFARLGAAERRAVGELLGVGTRTQAAHLTSGINARSGALGFYTFLGRTNFALQGFDAWNDSIRTAVAVMFSKHMGNHAHLDIAALPPQLRATLEGYGITATGWDKLRAGVSTVGDGKYVTFDHLSDHDLATRSRGMINDLMDNATSEARGREMRNMSAGLGGNSSWGLALKVLLQFKSFPLTFFDRTLMPAFRDARMRNVAPLANLIVSTMLLGYASVQAKELVKGHELRPLSWRTAMASMVQGGGLGIYGDFLFGERNRMGGGLAETFGGPVVGDLHSLVQLFDQIKQGQDAKAGAFRLVKSEIPFVNLWYTRTALDYLIFWRMQEAMNPGWAARYQGQVEKQNGASFWLKPSEAVH